MNIPWWRTVILALALVGLLAATARAQSGFNNPYQAVRPTTSPWMNLFQKNAGPMDNYHTYVRPEMQLRDTLRQQSLKLDQQVESVDNLSTDFRNLQAGQRKMHATGTGSLFMQYSHYYDLGGSTNRRATGANGRRGL